MADLIIELMGEDVTACKGNGENITSGALWDDLRDCRAPGDAQEACEYVLDNYKIDWCIIAAKPDESGYENREPTAREKQAMAECIYFDSESDFSDERLAEIYLIWQAANGLES